MTARRYNPDTSVRPTLFGGALLYVLPLPLLPAALFTLISGQAGRALAYGGAFGLCMVAATMMRRGLGIARAARQRKIVRRTSTIPYKFTSAILLSVAMFVVAWMGTGYDFIDSVLFGLTTFVGSWLYYGFDLTRKNPDLPAVGITSEEVLELLEEGESKILAIENARRDIRNPELKDRLRRIASEARKILERIEEDPRDARKARKFLKVYLDGAQQVTQGYAAIHKHDDNPALEDNFRRVLETIENVIAEQQVKLQENNLGELDVQIEVLQMQLEKEGVT